MTDMSDLLGSGEQDRISCLPPGVLEIIIRKLPIVDAIRTTVLSKNWRYNWLSLSDFHIDSLTFTENPYCDEEDSDEEEFVAKNPSWDVVTSIVNTYILHHTSAIRSFSLIARCGKHYPDMYQWMHYLSQQAVEALSIHNTSMSKFKVPSHMFSFIKLKSLCLTCCVLQIPSSFEGFKLLNKIDLDDVSICDADLSHLILSSPLLEYLTLLNISGLRHLRIHAPNLSELSLHTKLEDIVIEAAPNLSTVRISHYRSGPYDNKDDPVINLQSVTHCLSGIGSLHLLNISENFTRALGACDGLALRNNVVTSLTLDSWGLSVDMFKGCLSVLSSCRNIKHFTFLIGSGRHAALMRDFFTENHGKYSFPKLESIRLVYQRRCAIRPPMEFIHFIAVHSPNLKFLNIQTEGEIVFDNLQVRKMSSMFSMFWESCPQVSVSYHHFKQPNRVGR